VCLRLASFHRSSLTCTVPVRESHLHLRARGRGRDVAPMAHGPESPSRLHRIGGLPTRHRQELPGAAQSIRTRARACWRTWAGPVRPQPQEAPPLRHSSADWAEGLKAHDCAGRRRSVTSPQRYASGFTWLVLAAVGVVVIAGVIDAVRRSSSGPGSARANAFTVDGLTMAVPSAQGTTEAVATTLVGATHRARDDDGAAIQSGSSERLPS
jgi:hypothetical protein